MPDWSVYVRERLRGVQATPERENEIIAELALQLEQAYAEALASGAAPAEALRRAQSQFSDWGSLAREINRAEQQPPRPEPIAAPGGALTGFWNDLRYAGRFLRRNPAFGAVAALTLAFGIGGNTAVFTMVDTLLLRSLPYPGAGQLMAIETRNIQQPEIEPWMAALDLADIRERTRAFSAVAGISPVLNAVMTGGAQAEQIETLAVSANFFSLIGVKPLLGRTFVPAEDGRGGGNVAVVSYAFWQRHFAGGRDAVGKSLILAGSPVSVVGVLPADFQYAGEPLAGTASSIDVWMPPFSTGLATTPRSVRYLKAIGRRKAGVSVEQARNDIRRIGAALSTEYPETDRGLSYDTRPLISQVAGRLSVTMTLLLGTVGFVLLMACANVANLLLARAAARSREIAVRVALGASAFRLVRQLMTESLAVAAAGGAAGLLTAWGGLRFLTAMAPVTLTGARAVRLDVRALLFTVGLVLLSSLLAGLPPAWRLVRGEVDAGLREGARGLTSGRHPLRSALVTTQVAAALVLLAGAGLLIRSFQRLLDVNPGFQAGHIATVSTQMPPSARTPEQRAAIYRLIHDRLAAIPGVRDVGTVSRLPLMGSNLGSWIFIEGRTRPGEEPHEIEYRVAAPSYFTVMGIPLRAG
ncbi:MAG TPA: ABC transporter permease, partial [Bryobacteraceae bacterium]